MPDTYVYVVLSTYYKYGEADIKVYIDDQELFNYLYTEVREYLEVFEDIEMELRDIDDRYLEMIQNINNIDIQDLEDLIPLAIKLGQHTIREQIGWGIIKVAQIQTSDVKDIYYID